MEDEIGGRYSFTTNLAGHGCYLNHVNKTLTPSDSNQTIEDVIRHQQADLPPTQIEAWSINRVAINTALLLASHPTMRVKSERQREWAKIAKKSNDRRKAQEAKEKLRLQPQLIRFVKEPSFCTPKDSELALRSVRPHWRRGHWRSQPCGPKNVNRKVIFIQRLLVHGDSAEGTKNEILYVG